MSTKRSVFATILALALLNFHPAMAGDAAKAKRDLSFLKMSVESNRFDSIDDQFATVNADLEGLTDAEKAPILADMAEVKKSISANIEDEVTRRLKRAEQAPAGGASVDLDQSTRRLDQDDAKKYMDPKVMEQLRGRIAALKGAGTPAVTTPPVTTTPPPKANTAVSDDDRYAAASRARRNLSIAKMKLERGPEGVEDELKKVEADLPILADADRANLTTEIASVRQQMGGGKPITTTPPVTIKTPETPKTNGAVGADLDRADAIARAKRNLNFAKMSLERGPDGVEEQLKKVENDLKILTDAERAPLAAEVATIRNQIGSTFNADVSRRIELGVKQDLDFAEQYVGTRELDGLQERLAQAAEKLGSAEAKKGLDPAVAKRLEARLAELGRRGPEAYKQAVFKEALPYLKKLEATVNDEPFKGVRYAYPIILEIARQVERVRDDIHRIPPEDPDYKAIEARVVAVEKKAVATREASEKQLAEADAAAIAAADAAQKKRLMEAAAAAQAEAVAKADADWKRFSSEVGAWEQEKPVAGDGKKINTDPLPKTRAAIRTLNYWFESTSSMRARYKDDTKLAALTTQAEKTLDAVYAKLNGGYNAVLDQIEKMTVPKVWAEQHVPSEMQSHADYDLAGTKYHQPTVARAKGLQEKWDAEVARRDKDHKDLIEKLSAEAATRWPAIESAARATTTFNPNDASALNGKTIELKGVYNRSGWDFAGSEWDFTVKIDGVPVTGDYDPNVLKAFRAGQEAVSDNIDEHKPWDVIGVVEGTGTVTERVIDEVRIGDSVERVKIERNVKEPALKIRIIALRAGPVAVGPK